MSEAPDNHTEEIELDEKAVGVIVEKVASAVTDSVKEGIQEDVSKQIEDAVKSSTASVLDDYLAKTEEIGKKAVADHVKAEKGDSHVARGFENKQYPESVTYEGKTFELDNMSPAMRFFLATRALDPETGDKNLLRALNRYALATQLDAKAKVLKEKGFTAAEKTGYGNETTAADGSVLIPDAEFVTTVFDNLPSYGVAFQFADVRQTDRTVVRVLSLDSGLTFYSTAEAGVKTGAKLAFAKNEVSLQKFAVIVPATDELTDDAAIDYWNLVTRELTRAYAKKADELVFTDTTQGITNLTGVITQAVTGAGTSITWKALLDTEAKLEDDIDTSNYRWFMRKETWYRIVETRADSGFASGDGAGLYLASSIADGWIPNINTPTTPWGTPVVFTRVLPTSNSVNSNDAFAVYGDLSNTLLYNKRGMALKMLTEATVVDSEGSNLNLATQDATAMRAVIRLLHICPKGNRGKFGVLGTGTVS